MRPKIAFLVHMLAPYRVSFYRKLFASEEYEWKLFAGSKSNKVDSRPQYNGNVDFNVSFHTETIKSRYIYNEVANAGMPEAVKEFNPDIVIMFAHVGTSSFRKVLKWAKDNNKKVIMWTCFWEPDYISGYKRIIRNYFINSFYKKADYHIAYSSLAKQRLLDIGYPDKQISIAYNGIDTDLYEMDLTSDLLANDLFEKGAVNFLYVGGFGKDKRVDLLIKAIGECKAFTRRRINGYLIGDGPMFEECRKLANLLGLSNVKFLGRINENLAMYIKAADCVVLPGTGGLILNEALYFERPAVFSHADGTEYDLMMNGYNGIKFQSNNKSSLARALGEISENLPFFKENAANTSALVTRRSNVDSMVETFLDVVGKVNNDQSNIKWLAEKIPANSPQLQNSLQGEVSEVIFKA